MLSTVIVLVWCYVFPVTRNDISSYSMTPQQQPSGYIKKRPLVTCDHQPITCDALFQASSGEVASSLPQVSDFCLGTPFSSASKIGIIL